MTAMTDRVAVVTDGAEAAAKGANGTPREALSYEQARDKLAALELWERGERLAAVCEEWLDGARARLAAAMAKRDESETATAEDDAPF